MKTWILKCYIGKCWYGFAKGEPWIIGSQLSGFKELVVVLQESGSRKGGPKGMNEDENYVETSASFALVKFIVPHPILWWRTESLVVDEVSRRMSIRCEFRFTL